MIFPETPLISLQIVTFCGIIIKKYHLFQYMMIKEHSMNTFSITNRENKSHPSHCQITTSKGIYNVPLDDIFFIECRQKKSFVHTKSGILELPIPLYRLKEALPSILFLHISTNRKIYGPFIFSVQKNRPLSAAVFGIRLPMPSMIDFQPCYG